MEDIKELEKKINNLERQRDLLVRKQKIEKRVKERTKSLELEDYLGAHQKINKEINEIHESTRGLNIQKTHFWSTGGSSMGLYQEPEYHRSSTDIKFVKGSKEDLIKYISLSYLTNLDERCFTSVLKRCKESFGNRCHKYENTECYTKSDKPCLERRNHFYDHLGTFGSTLSPYLKNKERASIYINPFTKVFSGNRKIPIINLKKINNFNKINLEKIISLTKKHDSKVDSLLKNANKISALVGDSHIINDTNPCSIELNEHARYYSLDKRCLEDLNLIKGGKKLYIERGKNLKEINKISAKFLKDLNNYLHNEVFSFVKKDIFDIYHN